MLEEDGVLKIGITDFAVHHFGSPKLPRKECGDGCKQT
jgi:hypothetical protein